MKEDAEASLGGEESLFDEKELIVILKKQSDAVLIPLRSSHRLQSTEKIEKEENHDHLNVETGGECARGKGDVLGERDVYGPRGWCKGRGGCARANGGCARGSNDGVKGQREM